MIGNTLPDPGSVDPQLRNLELATNIGQLVDGLVSHDQTLREQRSDVGRHVEGRAVLNSFLGGDEARRMALTLVAEKPAGDDSLFISQWQAHFYMDPNNVAGRAISDAHVTLKVPGDGTEPIAMVHANPETVISIVSSNVAAIERCFADVARPMRFSDPGVDAQPRTTLPNCEKRSIVL